MFGGIVAVFMYIAPSTKALSLASTSGSSANSPSQTAPKLSIRACSFACVAWTCVSVSLRFPPTAAALAAAASADAAAACADEAAALACDLASASAVCTTLRKLCAASNCDEMLFAVSSTDAAVAAAALALLAASVADVAAAAALAVAAASDEEALAASASASATSCSISSNAAPIPSMTSTRVPNCVLRSSTTLMADSYKETLHRIPTTPWYKGGHIPPPEGRGSWFRSDQIRNRDRTHGVTVTHHVRTNPLLD
ncbi:hypothetical protein AWB81_04193 [Caballeronia arationis]|nr:hypothetical protein AWB81_04193 [Caballeronia arationis]